MGLGEKQPVLTLFQRLISCVTLDKLLQMLLKLGFLTYAENTRASSSWSGQVLICQSGLSKQ